MNTENNFIVKRPLVFKAVVTDYFKSEMLTELKNGILNLENNINQLQDYLKKNELTGEDKKGLENEIKKFAAQKAVIQQRSQEVEKLKVGDYYTYSTVEGFAQLKVGDDIRKKMSPIEMITKDFVVQSIHD